MPRFGAFPLAHGRVEFRVWAPNVSSVSVGDTALTPAGDGVFEGEADGRPGDEYEFVLDGERRLPDPCSRFQPHGVQGPSQVVDTRFEIAPGPRLDREQLVIYELHLGTFSEEGTCDGAIR